MVLGRRGSRKRPCERTKTKVILQIANSKGHAQGGLSPEGALLFSQTRSPSTQD